MAGSAFQDQTLSEHGKSSFSPAVGDGGQYPSSQPSQEPASVLKYLFVEHCPSPMRLLMKRSLRFQEAKQMRNPSQAPLSESFYLSVYR